jgi:hypothetical protein
MVKNRFINIQRAVQETSRRRRRGAWLLLQSGKANKKPPIDIIYSSIAESISVKPELAQAATICRSPLAILSFSLNKQKTFYFIHTERAASRRELIVSARSTNAGFSHYSCGGTAAFLLNALLARSDGQQKCVYIST